MTIALLIYLVIGLSCVAYISASIIRGQYKESDALHAFAVMLISSLVLLAYASYLSA